MDNKTELLDKVRAIEAAGYHIPSLYKITFRSKSDGTTTNMVGYFPAIKDVRKFIFSLVDTTDVTMKPKQSFCLRFHTFNPLSDANPNICSIIDFNSEHYQILDLQVWDGKTTQEHGILEEDKASGRTSNPSHTAPDWLQNVEDAVNKLISQIQIEIANKVMNGLGRTKKDDKAIYRQTLGAKGAIEGLKRFLETIKLGTLNNDKQT